MKANNKLINALYTECKEYILNQDKPGVSAFIQIINNLDTDNNATITELLKYLNKLGKSKLLLSPTFSPEKYQDAIKKLDEYITLNTNFVQKSKLNPDNSTDIALCLKIAILLNSSLDDMLTNMQQLSIEDIKLDDKNNTDISKFITEYNSLNITSILSILSIIDKYELYNMLSINNEYKEFNILQDLYTKVFTNAQLLNVVKFAQLYNQFQIFIQDDVKYVDVIKYANNIFNSNAEFSQLQLEVDINKLHEFGLYEGDDNIFASILKAQKIQDTKVFDDMKIKGKDALLVSYLNNVLLLEPIDVYADKTINIQSLYPVITDNILNVFKEIDLDNKMIGVFANTTIYEKPVHDVLTTLFKNKEQLLKSASLDNKTVQDFNKDLQTQFEQWLGTDIYLDNASDKKIFSNICNILNGDGKLNVEYLQKTFKDYKTVICNIITHFNESDLFTVYKAMTDLSVLKEEYSYIMFGNYILSKQLYEDEEVQNDVSTNAEEKTDKPQTIGDAFETIVKNAEENKISVIDSAKQMVENSESEQDLHTNNNTNIIPAEIEQSATIVKTNASKIITINK